MAPWEDSGGLRCAPLLAAATRYGWSVAGLPASGLGGSAACLQRAKCPRAWNRLGSLLRPSCPWAQEEPLNTYGPAPGFRNHAPWDSGGNSGTRLPAGWVSASARGFPTRNRPILRPPRPPRIAHWSSPPPAPLHTHHPDPGLGSPADQQGQACSSPQDAARSQAFGPLGEQQDAAPERFFCLGYMQWKPRNQPDGGPEREMPGSDIPRLSLQGSTALPAFPFPGRQDPPSESVTSAAFRPAPPCQTPPRTLGLSRQPSKELWRWLSVGCVFRGFVKDVM